jgi:hypothetical protein
MLDRRYTAVPREDVASIVRFATLSAVLAAFAVPALAAPSVHVPCKEATEATLHVSDSEFVNEAIENELPLAEAITNKNVAVSSSSTSVLAPRAEAAIRDAFNAGEEVSLTTSAPELAKAVLRSPVAGADATPKPDAEPEPTEAPDTAMNTRLPGISDDDLTRYKKQMYRRDI